MACKTPEQIYGVRRRRWDDGLTLVQLLVRGLLFLTAMALLGLLPGCAAPAPLPECAQAAIPVQCGMHGDIRICWCDVPHPRRPSIPELLELNHAS